MAHEALPTYPVISGFAPRPRDHRLAGISTLESPALASFTNKSNIHRCDAVSIDRQTTNTGILTQCTYT